jgi:hypothetical protein
LKASEVIAQLQELVEKHGDLPVFAPDTGCGCCDTGPGPIDPPEFLSAVSQYGETFPDRFYVSQ